LGGSLTTSQVTERVISKIELILECRSELGNAGACSRTPKKGVNMIRVGFLYTRLRVEEILMDELEKHADVEVVRINDGDTSSISASFPNRGCVIRTFNFIFAWTVIISRIFEAHGVQCEFVRCCGALRR